MRLQSDTPGVRCSMRRPVDSYTLIVCYSFADLFTYVSSRGLFVSDQLYVFVRICKERGIHLFHTFGIGHTTCKIGDFTEYVDADHNELVSLSRTGSTADLPHGCAAREPVNESVLQPEICTKAFRQENAPLGDFGEAQPATAPEVYAGCVLP